MKLEVTNQESAENLKEIIAQNQDFIFKMQIAYLERSLQTCADYLRGEKNVSAADVRKIELDFNRICLECDYEWDIICCELSRFKGQYGIKHRYIEDPNKSKHFWNELILLEKGERSILFSIHTDVAKSGTTSFFAMVK